MAQEVAEDCYRRGRIASEARARRLSDIKLSVDKQIRELLGEDNWLSLRQPRRDERKSFVDLFQPPSER